MHRSVLNRMKDQRTEDRIRAYLAGEHSPEGEALFNEWYASFPDEAPLAMDNSDKEKLRQKMFRKISQEADADTLPTVNSLQPDLISARRNVAVYYRVVASTVGFLMLTFAGWWYYQTTLRTASLATGDTEIREATLPDGSEVVLNANSVLRYRPGWDESTTRHVWLDGEAFFSVAHTQSHQAFIVHTSGLDVRVLGTEFNVQHRRDQTTVVLSQGKVSAYVPSSSSDPVTMQPGDQVRHADGQRTLTQSQVDTAQYTAWKRKELVLNNTSLREIATLLEDYYGFDVVLASDQLGELRVSSINALSLQNPKVLLDAISEIFSLKATLTPKRIYLETN